MQQIQVSEKQSLSFSKRNKQLKVEFSQKENKTSQLRIKTTEVNQWTSRVSELREEMTGKWGLKIERKELKDSA